MKITRHFGKPERVDIETLEIPDLWHIAMFLKIDYPKGYTYPQLPPERAKVIADAILETWGIAHDLKKNIIEGLIKED